MGNYPSNGKVREKPSSDLKKLRSNVTLGKIGTDCKDPVFKAG